MSNLYEDTLKKLNLSACFLNVLGDFEISQQRYLILDMLANPLPFCSSVVIQTETEIGLATIEDIFIVESNNSIFIKMSGYSGKKDVKQITISLNVELVKESTETKIYFTSGGAFNIRRLTFIDTGKTLRPEKF